MSQKALSLIYFTAAVFSVSGINHNVTVLTEQNDKRLLLHRPQMGKGTKSVH